jgi:hypothetical protein
MGGPESRDRRTAPTWGAWSDRAPGDVSIRPLPDDLNFFHLSTTGGALAMAVAPSECGRSGGVPDGRHRRSIAYSRQASTLNSAAPFLIAVAPFGAYAIRAFSRSTSAQQR